MFRNDVVPRWRDTLIWTRFPFAHNEVAILHGKVFNDEYSIMLKQTISSL